MIDKKFKDVDQIEDCFCELYNVKASDRMVFKGNRTEFIKKILSSGEDDLIAKWREANSCYLECIKPVFAGKEMPFVFDEHNLIETYQIIFQNIYKIFIFYGGNGWYFIIYATDIFKTEELELFSSEDLYGIAYDCPQDAATVIAEWFKKHSSDVYKDLE